MEEKRVVTQEEEPKVLPMKWYNFRVKFMMVLGGVSNIILGIVSVSTLMYFIPVDMGLIGFEEYLYSGNKVFDIVYGVLFILLGVANFIVRSRMKRFTADALKKYYALIIAEQAIFYVYDIVFAFITNTKLDVLDTVVFGLATAVVCVSLEIYYFNKRKALFVN